MRSPDLVLKSLREKACTKGYRYERLYRNLYNPQFFLLAYKNVAASQGSMTAGADRTTLDGMSIAHIDKIIATLKDHSYQPKPARRTYIEKKNSTKKRPLGIQSTDDKLVQEIVRMILEAIYEPTFSQHSHGFRPNRSCHTALKEVQLTFRGAKWIVEGDIKACFDCFDHHVLIDLLRRRIHDEYFISLMWKFLKAGYLEQWNIHKTYSGTPQGSGMSPILANIYLSELDTFIEQYKSDFWVDNGRSRNPSKEYVALQGKVSAKLRDYQRTHPSNDADTKKAALQAYKNMRREKLDTPYYPAIDPDFKRIQYNRYADDFVIGVIGSKNDAEKIKADVKQFLQDSLKLTLSEEKTKITHSDELVRYLGYDFTVSRSRDVKRNEKGALQRYWYGAVKLYVPHDKWVSKLQEYKAIKISKDKDGSERWKAVHRGKLVNIKDIDIISQYNAEIRGIYNYYHLADNVSVLGKFEYIMKLSMLRTFGAKYKTTVNKIRATHECNGIFGVDYETKAGRKRCEFYHDGFTKQKDTAPNSVDTLPQYRKYSGVNSLAVRLLSGKCELCNEKTDDVRMHHIKALKDLTGAKEWEKLMMKRRRKTLALCPDCYSMVHA